jgi:acetyltransferase-like isoleucine patch superfamily enzyme
MDLRHRLPTPMRTQLRQIGEGCYLLAGMLLAHIPSYRVRHVLYRRGLGLRLERGAHIHKGLEIRSGRKVSIGSGSIIGFDCILDGRGGITVGRNVNLSSEVAIWTLQHAPNDPRFGLSEGPVRVGDRAWLSYRAVLLPGVTIGEGAVIAAGSIVTNDVAPFSIVAGAPAQPIGTRSRNLTYELASAAKPWFI